jgi:hypothetical protein
MLMVVSGTGPGAFPGAFPAALPVLDTDFMILSAVASTAGGWQQGVVQNVL